MPKAGQSTEDRIAELEARLDAMSTILHASIIITDDTLNRHKSDIIAMMEPLIETTQNIDKATILREWMRLLKHNS